MSSAPSLVISWVKRQIMSFVNISSKGQITLPSKIRKALGVHPKDKLELVLMDKEVVIKKIRSFRDFRASIIPKKGDVQKSMEEAVVRHVLETVCRTQETICAKIVLILC